MNTTYKNLKNQDPKLYKIVQKEICRQEEEIELIASENYVSMAVLEAMGTVLTNKYSEGYSGKRYYGGNEFIDEAEDLAIERAQKLFGAEHINVQPLSGSPANVAVYMAFLKPGDKVLGLALDHGGHLSHGHPVNFSGMLYNFTQYKVNSKTGYIDMEEVQKIAQKEKPKMIVAGYSAYSREIDWKSFAQIAKDINAYSFADIAHTAGLIAAGVMKSPIPFFDVISTTTHKTLRGPRGAMIMCREQFAKQIDKAVFPGMQGGPHEHIIAAKAVAFGEALKSSFKNYAKQVITNAKILAMELQEKGFNILSGGTDNHLMVLNLENKNIDGKSAEIILDKTGISVSRSTIPDDPNPPMRPSGIRLGTAAITTRGMGKSEIKKIAQWINKAIQNKNNEEALNKIKNEVGVMCKNFPLPGK